MAIPEGYKPNFETLIRAIKDNAVCLLESSDKETGEQRILVCALNKVPGVDNVEFVPLAILPWNNPYEMFTGALPLDEAANKVLEKVKNPVLIGTAEVLDEPIKDIDPALRGFCPSCEGRLFLGLHEDGIVVECKSCGQEYGDLKELSKAQSAKEK